MEKRDASPRTWNRWSKASTVVRSLVFSGRIEADRMTLLNQVWEREVGDLARHWTLKGMRRGVLFVRASSPAAAQELQLRGRSLIRGLNKYFKRAWIKGIRTAHG